MCNWSAATHPHALTGAPNLPRPIFSYLSFHFQKVTLTRSVAANVGVSVTELNVINHETLKCAFLVFCACKTHLCSLEPLQTTCHLPDIGVWARQWGNSPPYKNTRWSGRRLYHPHGKYGHEQVWLGFHTVPLQYRGEKRGGEGQRCKIVMDFLFSISVIHNPRAGSPQGGCKKTSEGLKVIKGLWKTYSSHTVSMIMFIYEMIAVLLLTWYNVCSFLTESN